MSAQAISDFYAHPAFGRNDDDQYSVVATLLSELPLRKNGCRMFFDALTTERPYRQTGNLISRCFLMRRESGSKVLDRLSGQDFGIGADPPADEVHENENVETIIAADTRSAQPIANAFHGISG